MNFTGIFNRSLEIIKKIRLMNSFINKDHQEINYGLDKNQMVLQDNPQIKQFRYLSETKFTTLRIYIWSILTIQQLI